MGKEFQAITSQEQLDNVIGERLRRQKEQFEEKIKDAQKVLGAAAMTYVASAATAIIQLARLLMLRGRNRD